MSTLETNNISKYNGNNVSMGDALKLKSYTTTQRDALTSVAGDSIYNSTTSKVEYYDGSAWVQTGDAKVPVQYVIIAGGGSGGSSPVNYYSPGGGGAGGYRSSYASENTGGGKSTELLAYVAKSTNYAVSIGAGGAAVTSANGSSYYAGNKGTASYFDEIFAEGGGAGGQLAIATNLHYSTGGSGSGGGSYNGANGPAGFGIIGQGFAGGQGATYAQVGAGGGGGGAGAAGTATANNVGGAGGAGVSSSITGSAVARAGGGGGGGHGGAGAGGSGGGGAGNGVAGGTATSGTANTGGGGGSGSGGLSSSGGGNGISGAGGSGVVILRYPNTFTISQSGLTLSTATSGDDKITTITAGTGTVSFA